jgi:hypothetical protein
VVELKQGSQERDISARQTRFLDLPLHAGEIGIEEPVDVFYAMLRRNGRKKRRRKDMKRGKGSRVGKGILSDKT